MKNIHLTNKQFLLFSRKFIIPLLLLFFCGCSSVETTENINAELLNDEITDLIEESLDLYDSGKYAQSKSVISDAESLLTTETDTSLRIRLLINKSELLKMRGNYEQCIQNYYEAANLSKLSNDSSRLGLSYYNISSTYLLMRNLKNASKYNLLAQEVYGETSEESRLMNCKIVHASICRQNDEPEKAKQDLEKAIQFYTQLREKGETTLSICLNNYANLLLSEQEHTQAISYFLRATEICKKQENKPGLAIRFGNIGEAYLLKGQFDLAKKYIDSSLTIAKEIKAQEIILSNLERLISYYKGKNNASQALSTSDEYIKLKTELLQLESSSDILNVEKKYKQELEFLEASNKIVLLEKDNAISKSEQRSTRFKLYFFILLALTAIIVAYIIYKKQNKIRRIDLELHHKEREILAAKNHLAKTEKLQLEKEIDFKRTELITFSINILEREKFLTELKTIFKNIQPNEIPKKDVLDELKQLLYIKNDNSVELFKRIESINSSFHFNLKSNHPELTDDDIRLASLIILGLSSKEISKLLSIETKSVSMKRYRLKMKLNLDSEMDLKQFLKEV